jgi:hypothetical protein
MMRLDIPCKTGKIKLGDDDVLRIQAFGKVLWQSPVSEVTKFVTQPGSLGMIVITIASKGGPYRAEMVTKANFEKLQSLFPLVPVQAVGKDWWLNPAMLTHVGVYIKEKDLQREMEAAYQHGWQMQGQSGTGGFVNAGGFTMRGKTETTVTFIRTPEWLAEHQQ